MAFGQSFMKLRCSGLAVTICFALFLLPESLVDFIFSISGSFQRDCEKYEVLELFPNNL